MTRLQRFARDFLVNRLGWRTRLVDHWRTLNCCGNPGRIYQLRLIYGVWYRVELVGLVDEIAYRFEMLRSYRMRRSMVAELQKLRNARKASE